MKKHNLILKEINKVLESVNENDINALIKYIVKSPKFLSNKKAPIVILKAGIYNNEIKKDILENINSNVRFI